MHIRKAINLRFLVFFSFLIFNLFILSSSFSNQVMASTTVTIRLMVDGKAVIHLQNTNMWIDHIDAYPPGRNKGANVPFKINGQDAYADCYTRTSRSWDAPYTPFLERSCDTGYLRMGYVSDGDARSKHDSGIFWKSDVIDLTQYGIPDLNEVNILSYRFIQSDDPTNEFFNFRGENPYNELLVVPSAQNNWMTAWYINDYPCCMGWNTIEIVYDVDACERQCEGKCGDVSDGCGGNCTDSPCPSNATLSGSYKENLSGNTVSCDNGFNYSSLYPITQYLELQNPENKTLNCTNTSSTYSCTVSFATPDDPQANFILKNNYPGYRLNWFCPETQSSTTVASGETRTNDIYFGIKGQSWFKIKNSSLHSNSSEILIPINTLSYDSDDDNSKRLVIGESGAITSNSDLYLVNPNTSSFSENNFVIKNYSNKKSFTNIDSLISYTTNKNKYKNISQLSEIANHSEHDVFVLSGDLTINTTNKSYLEGDPVFVIVNGTIKFANDLNGSFNPTGSSIILAAKNIRFYETENVPGMLTEARGIFVAESFATGTSNTTGLKIVGNLITLTNQHITNTRIPQTSHKPGLFVVFDPKMYTSTIGLFSNKIYEWNEVE